MKVDESLLYFLENGLNCSYVVYLTDTDTMVSFTFVKSCNSGLSVIQPQHRRDYL
jgi:hypothetical protein